MVTFTPVLERWCDRCPFWPVDQGDFYLPVSGSLLPEQMGGLVWALVGQHVTANDSVISATNPIEAIQTYLAVPADKHDAPGGLRVTDGHVVIDPGCCVGLDEWREWLQAVHGEPIYLGHSPDVTLEPQGPVLLLQENRDPVDTRAGLGVDDRHIDIPRHVLPQLLRAVQADLVGFLDALHPWVQRIAADLADPFTNAVDHHLQISAPLAL